MSELKQSADSEINSANTLGELLNTIKSIPRITAASAVYASSYAPLLSGIEPIATTSIDFLLGTRIPSVREYISDSILAAGGAYRNIQVVNRINKKPQIPPMNGEIIRIIKIRPTVDQWITFVPSRNEKAKREKSNPAAKIKAPSIPPISAWDDEQGMPKYQVKRFQMMAPTRVPITIRTPAFPAKCEGSTMPLPIVAATAVPKKKAPTNSKTEAMMRAHFGEMALEEIMVATMLEESWKPLEKSNRSASPTVKMAK